MRRDGGQGMGEWREGGMGRVDDTLNPKAMLALALLGMAVGLQPAFPR